MQASPQERTVRRSAETSTPWLEVVEDPSPLDFDAVYRRYASYSAAVAYRLMGRSSEVDDIVQEVFVDVLEGLHRLRHPGALRGWIATVTVRKVRRRLRWIATRRRLGLGYLEVDTHIVDPSAGPETHAQLRDAFLLLEQAPVNDRIAWILRHLEGLRLEEVATRCGCSLATAKRRITRAQALLDEGFRDGFE